LNFASGVILLKERKEANLEDAVIRENIVNRLLGGLFLVGGGLCRGDVAHLLLYCPHNLLFRGGGEAVSRLAEQELQVIRDIPAGKERGWGGVVILQMGGQLENGGKRW